jgi:hypothetical protein
MSTIQFNFRQAELLDVLKAEGTGITLTLEKDDTTGTDFTTATVTATITPLSSGSGASTTGCPNPPGCQ